MKSPVQLTFVNEVRGRRAKGCYLPRPRIRLGSLPIFISFSHFDCLSVNNDDIIIEEEYNYYNETKLSTGQTLFEMKVVCIVWILTTKVATQRIYTHIL